MAQPREARRFTDDRAYELPEDDDLGDTTPSNTMRPEEIRDRLITVHFPEQEWDSYKEDEEVNLGHLGEAYTKPTKFTGSTAEEMGF